MSEANPTYCALDLIFLASRSRPPYPDQNLRQNTHSSFLVVLTQSAGSYLARQRPPGKAIVDHQLSRCRAFSDNCRTGQSSWMSKFVTMRVCSHRTLFSCFGVDLGFFETERAHLVGHEKPYMVHQHRLHDWWRNSLTVNNNRLHCRSLRCGNMGRGSKRLSCSTSS